MHYRYCPKLFPLFFFATDSVSTHYLCPSFSVVARASLLSPHGARSQNLAPIHASGHKHELGHDMEHVCTTLLVNASYVCTPNKAHFAIMSWVIQPCSFPYPPSQSSTLCLPLLPLFLDFLLDFAPLCLLPVLRIYVLLDAGQCFLNQPKKGPTNTKKRFAQNA